MSENTKIEWCDHTFNGWWGCNKISPGCDRCYAEALDKRTGGGHWGPTVERRRTSAANWKQPVRWNAQHDAFFAQHGRRQRVFCSSMADVFDNQVDPQWRADLFALIEATPNLDWLLLTKRIGNVRGMVPPAWLVPGGWPKHVRIGATIVNQREADRDITTLLALPCPNFVSIEPMLGAVDLTELQPPGELRVWVDALRGMAAALGAAGPAHDVARLDWVIAGGESGRGARPSHPDWYRSLRDQCAAAGVPFLFKQWGEWLPISQQREDFTTRLYRSNRKAKLHEDQSALDDSYGRTCTVPTTVVHLDASTHGITEPMAFLQGTGAMTTFKVGKKAAGRLLDGIEHNGFPS